ncbi:MAG: DUF2867 domain-containing protein, partial [Planctomycetota bacterium]
MTGSDRRGTQPQAEPLAAGRGSPILLTGATGYVGGRLLRALVARGHHVRCMARRPDFLADQSLPAVEIVRGDALDFDSLPPALEGCEVAYYLIHSMSSGADFEERDRQAAANFVRAAAEAGVRRIIYLGGLGDERQSLSPHLKSRHDVGSILRSSGVEVIELQASIVIGSGSVSFEMIRSLVERLPVMLTPRWVSNESQPISIEDMDEYLLGALELPGSVHRVFQIGGPDRVPYRDLMREYARQRGLRRTMLPVPVLTPYLSRLWLGLVTPLYARVGRSLIEGIRNPTVMTNDEALRAFAIRPRGVSESIRRALVNEERDLAETRWSDAVSSAGLQPTWAGARFGNRLLDSRTVDIACPPHQAFAAVQRIGGKQGWYYGNWLWWVRGAIDVGLGGVGMRRGRRDAERLKVGDVVDCWRVEAVEPDRLLRLSAEMRLPGRAWLE